MGAVEGLARQLLGDAFDLEDHAAGADHGDPALGAALAVTHAGLGRLLGDRLVREDADVELAAALDVAGDRDTSRLDLARGEPARLERLQAEVAEGDVVPPLALPRIRPFCDLAELDVRLGESMHVTPRFGAQRRAVRWRLGGGPRPGRSST